MTIDETIGFAGRRFSAPADRINRMADVILRHVAADAPLRVLDVGCGTGGQLLHLAMRLPAARLCGIDVSAQNIADAERARAAHAAADRLRFICGDYLATRIEPVDVIFADSVLHLVPVGDQTLLDKIRRDLRPGGLLVASLPDMRAWNRVLVLIRRAFRAIRSPALDRFVLASAVRLHPEHSAEYLAERLPYMYFVPHRLAGPALERSAAAAGLDAVASYDVPLASVAQLHHRIDVYHAKETE